MLKVELFNKKKKWWSTSIDLDLLNARIVELENEGCKIQSLRENVNFMGEIASYLILIEDNK